MSRAPELAPAPVIDSMQMLLLALCNPPAQDNWPGFGRDFF
jgi:hypothetical protein